MPPSHALKLLQHMRPGKLLLTFPGPLVIFAVYTLPSCARSNMAQKWRNSWSRGHVQQMAVMQHLNLNRRKNDREKLFSSEFFFF